MKAVQIEQYESEIASINERLTSLRAERYQRKANGLAYEDIDREIRLGVRRLKRIGNKLNPRSKAGGSIRLSGSGAPSGSKYMTYKTASKRPLQGGSVTPK